LRAQAIGDRADKDAGDLPTLYASGLTDDFSILGKASPGTPGDGIVPLAVELELLGSAGFVQPECFWKRGPTTVFGGFR
jgi:hypothetical protein